MKTYISKPFQAEQFTDKKHLPPGVTKGGTCKVYMQTQICWAAPPHYHTANRTIVEVPEKWWVCYGADGTVAQTMPDALFKRDFVEQVAAEPPMPDEVFERALEKPNEEIIREGIEHPALATAQYYKEHPEGMPPEELEQQRHRGRPRKPRPSVDD